jgi:alkylated DNA repair protein (DNA oxidative demethylase)
MVDALRTDGLRIFPAHLDGARVAELLAELRRVMQEAPPFRPTMPGTGAPFSVMMTNAGPLGWLSDRAGYRYEPRHPETGRPWPPMPATALAVWREVAGYAADPEACLVNIYEAGARMGLHQDRDEVALEAPVVSISLGDTALFRIGSPSRRGPTRSLRLASGDVVVLAGPSRLAFHGIDRILPGTSRLLPEGGRINLTLRRVTRPLPA